MTTEGFYKYFSETQEIMYAPNRVHTPNGSVDKETKGEIDGWKWYNSEYEAYAANNMVASSPELSNEVSRMQGLVALKRAGKLATIEYIVSQADEESQIVWKEALNFRRTSALLIRLARTAGMTDSDIDELFAVARTIEP